MTCDMTCELIAGGNVFSVLMTFGLCLPTQSKDEQVSLSLAMVADLLGM